MLGDKVSSTKKGGLLMIVSNPVVSSYFRISARFMVMHFEKGGLPKRTMMHYINRINATMPVFSQLTINDENNGRTPEYTELTKDYYL